MVNHPVRRRGPYTATISGSSWSRGPVAEFPTIREARAWAESYGTTADRCIITDTSGREVARHIRDTGAPGRWFRATA